MNTTASRDEAAVSTKNLIAEAHDWRQRALPPGHFGDNHIATRLAERLSEVDAELANVNSMYNRACGDVLEYSEHIKRLEKERASEWDDGFQRGDGSGIYSKRERDEMNPWLPLDGEK